MRNGGLMNLHSCFFLTTRDTTEILNTRSKGHKEETYCRRRWDEEWHRFLWQLYENKREEGQCRLGDRAKPCSTSTCLHLSARSSCPLRFCRNSWRVSVFNSSFMQCLFSLKGHTCLTAPGTLNGRPEGERFDFRVLLRWQNDNLGAQRKTESLVRSASIHTRQTPQSLSQDLWGENSIRLVCFIGNLPIQSAV